MGFRTRSARGAFFAGTSLLFLAVWVLAPVTRGGDGYVRAGKNPGKVKGRWIEIHDVEQLRGYSGVYVGEVEVDIHWKKKDKETPIDEELLKDKICEHLLLNLRELAVFDEVLGLYHGYGTGSGMGFKLAGGGARKMTQDDIQENARKFAELLKAQL